MKNLVVLTFLGVFISCHSQKKLTIDSNKNESIENNQGGSDNPIANDSIAGQLKTVEKLKHLMADKNYDAAILLFSKEQQKQINELKKDSELFRYWCLAWTLDEPKYNNYIQLIRAGKGVFVWEDNQWKIDEK